jgi:hypothetical protein
LSYCLAARVCDGTKQTRPPTSGLVDSQLCCRLAGRAPAPGWPTHAVPTGRTPAAPPHTGSLMDDRRVLRLRINGSGALRLRLCSPCRRAQKQSNSRQGDREFSHHSPPVVVVDRLNEEQDRSARRSYIGRHERPMNRSLSFYTAAGTDWFIVLCQASKKVSWVAGQFE